MGIVHRIGFGWYFLGYSQHDFLPMIQIADVTGVYGVSFLVALVNVTILLWWNRWRDSTLPRPVLATAVTTLLLGASLGYGLLQLNHEPFSDGPHVALLQGNVPQDVKMTDGTFLTKHYFNLWMKATLDADVQPDLTIFPETSIADEWVEKGPGVTAPHLPRFYSLIDDKDDSFELQRLLGAKNREYSQSGRHLGCLCVGGGMIAGPTWHELFWNKIQQPVLYGLSCLEVFGKNSENKYNSALLMTRVDRPVARYDKMHLVPFGEYVPLKNVFPFLSHFTPYSHDNLCTPGSHWTRFPIRVNEKVFNFGCIICYEDSDPALARRYALPRWKVHRLTSWSTSPTTAGSTAHPNTRSISPSVDSGRSKPADRSFVP